MKALKGKIPDCASCKPEIFNSNINVIEIVRKYYPMLVSEYGVDGAGMQLIQTTEGINKEEVEKIIYYIMTFQSLIKDKK